MLRIVEAIIGRELCEQSCAEQAALCQGKAHASEAARYQGKNYTPMICQHSPSEIIKIRPWVIVLVGRSRTFLCQLPRSPRSHLTILKR